MAVGFLGCIAMLVLVIASFSRGAWLSAATFLLLITAIRLPKIWIVTFIIAALAAVAVINANAKRTYWLNHPYLSRLVDLAKIESPIKKDTARLNLFAKAGRMIREHPLTGSGIGSFYLRSVDFGQSNDPRAEIPDFAHNVFLQIAAEDGLPVLALFIALIICGLWRGYNTWHRRNTRTPESSQYASRILGITLGIGAYLQTQMTANSLNVYLSNQIFFWFLIAVVFSAELPDGTHEKP
jgi:O-antigen ligase